MAGDVFERPKNFLVEQGLFMPVCIELSPFFQVTFSSSLFADDRTVSLHFHGLQVTVIYCSFAARSRRVVGVTVVKVWEISRRYLRRVKAGTYLPSLFSM